MVEGAELAVEAELEAGGRAGLEAREGAGLEVGVEVMLVSGVGAELEVNVVELVLRVVLELSVVVVPPVMTAAMSFYFSEQAREQAGGDHPLVIRA